jgi:pimeloyl-ACP methyl ester carboxylesterase
MCADAANWNALKEPPPGTNSPDWAIEQTRASEAAARAFWPLGNTRLEKRLPFVTAPTLLIWGDADQIMPRSYAARFSAAMKAKPKVVTIASAGHLAELDKPDEVAAAIVEWTK